MIFRSDNDSITVKVHDPFPRLNSFKIQSIIKTHNRVAILNKTNQSPR
jgi:hypothetical protein